MNRKRSKAKIDRKMPMVHPPGSTSGGLQIGRKGTEAAHGSGVRSALTAAMRTMESTSVYWIPIFSKRFERPTSRAPGFPAILAFIR
jgi:hypothetical protein